MQTDSFQFDIKTYLKILKRRKYLLVIPFILTLIASFAVAVTLPPMYRSESLILVETQDVPQDFIQSTVTGYVAERLQVLNQLVTARENLLRLVEEHNLYPELREKGSSQEIIEQFREDIRMEMIQSEAQGRRGTGTIAFRLSYIGESPGKVYRVASALTSLYIEKNLEMRSEKVTETYEFLESRKQRLSEEIGELENQFSAFKQRNLSMLPENTSTTLESISSLQQQISQRENSIRALQERIILLEEELERLQKSGPKGGEEGEEIEQIRKAYLSAKASKSANHPDVLRLKKQLEAFESEMGTRVTYENYAEELEAKQKELLALKQDYSQSHPDVKRLQQEVAEIEKKKNELAEKLETEPAETDDFNPEVQAVKRQIRVAEFQVQSEKENLQDLRGKLRQSQGRLDVMPEVERQYNALRRELSLAQAKYNDIAVKLQAAREAKGLEDSRMGEKLAVIDPPSQPGEPFKPNRMAILVLGLFLSLGMGVGSGALAEAMDNSFHEPKDLSKKTDLPILATFPEIKNKKEKRKSKIKLLAGLLLLVLLVFGALAYMHTQVMPLDILYITVKDRFAGLM